MNEFLKKLRGLFGSEVAAEPQAAPTQPPETLRDSLEAIVGREIEFKDSKIPSILGAIQREEPRAAVTHGLAPGKVFLFPGVAGNRPVESHEAGHLLEFNQPDEVAGIQAAITNFVDQLSPSEQQELAGREVANRPASRRALEQELLAEFFQDALLNPMRDPQFEGSENIRQLFRQMIDRRLSSVTPTR